MNNIKTLISPKSIAVIGASSNPEKIGYQIISNLRSGGFSGEIYPVNPKGGEILGFNIYKSLDGLSGRVDLAVIAIPSQLVLSVIDECIAASIKSLVIISAGFSEIGEEGARLENEIVEKCLQNDVTLIGPNCLGVINVKNGMNASFAQGMPSEGHVSFLSQSGAIISSMISLSSSREIGFSKIFSLGNKAAVGEKDLLEYLYSDPDTKVIIGYIESLKVTPELTEVLRASAKSKPTIVLFGGKSALGAQAAKSHTGSVVTSYIAVKTYLEQLGVILADSLEDLLLKARIFSCCHHINGQNIAILTNAGGPSIATSDAIASMGLSLARLSDYSTKVLSQKLRPEASVKNPIDLLGDASAQDYQNALYILEEDKNVDAIILLLTPQSATDIVGTAKIVAEFKNSKPLLSSFVGGEILSQAKRIIEDSGKPCFSYPEEAVLAVDALLDFSKNLIEVVSPVQDVSIYDSEHKFEELKKFGLPFLEYKYASDRSVLEKIATEFTFPVVVKTADAEAHKSDKGGIILNISSKDEMIEAAEKIGYPVIIGPMVKGKFEILLGIKKDVNIGTTILFGTGGIYSEIYADFAYAVAPVSREMVLDMIARTKIGRVLAGARGQEVYDLVKLADVVLSAVDFANSYSNVVEVDFNPIIVTDSDFEMVDIRVITRDK